MSGEGGPLSNLPSDERGPESPASSVADRGGVSAAVRPCAPGLPPAPPLAPARTSDPVRFNSPPDETCGGGAGFPAAAIVFGDYSNPGVND